jgi:hypothetical protein
VRDIPTEDLALDDDGLHAEITMIEKVATTK